MDYLGIWCSQASGRCKVEWSGQPMIEWMDLELQPVNCPELDNWIKAHDVPERDGWKQ